jgi:hypothetical protein
VTVTITGTSGTLTASTTIALTVTAELTFTGSNSSSTLSIEPGATTGNTVVITVTPSNGFSGTVNLSYSITPTAASDPATCTFTPSSVTISGTTSQQSTLAVITAASATSKNQIKRLFWPSAGGTAFALVLLFGVRRRRHNWLAMLGLLVLFGSIGAISCGGNGGGSGGGGGGVGTTAGSYSITVTGTSGDTVVTVSTIALTVQ